MLLRSTSGATEGSLYSSHHHGNVSPQITRTFSLETTPRIRRILWHMLTANLWRRSLSRPHVPES
eukprot:6473980-Amphidinium_carterae.2